MNVFTELREGLSISWSAIRANKLRSVLTTLGIIIGIVTVTLMGTAIEGLNRAFLKSISFIGADVLYVQRSDWMAHSREDWRKVEKRRGITLAQANALEREFTLASAIAPLNFTQRPIKYNKHSADGVIIVGSTDQLLFTGGTTLAQGRFLSAADSDGGRPVCVLGSQAATNLFQQETPLGKKITIDQRPFEIVGVLEKQGGLFDTGFDNQAIIPMRQFLGIYVNTREVEQIQVKVGTAADLDNTIEELRNVMRRIRRLSPSDPDDFAINQQGQILSMVRRVTGTIAGVGLFITGLSLFVGGIGIMNIMFVSVAERTREIGIRKAIGAKRRTILLQFLIEAATICMLGGAIGLAIAWPLTLVMQNYLPAAMSLTIVGIALLVSLITGVLSGFFPAWRAARMNPVDAFEKRMKPHVPTRLLAEVRESVSMALHAVAAHKLRSALTLLGVLVGVFSIIIVMTAMRVMKSEIEGEIRQLGSETFVIHKYPVMFVRRPEGMEKIWRRKNITLQQAQRFQDRMTLARSVGIQTWFWAGEIQTAHATSATGVSMNGVTPETFSAQNWNLQEGRLLLEADIANSRDVCVLGHGLATNLFPSSSPIGERLKFDGINYLVVGMLEAKGSALKGDQDNFAVIPITTGLNRYGSTWRSLDLFVQARDRASYDDCMDEAQGLLRAIRKVSPGQENDFEISSADSIIAQFNTFTLAVRMGVAFISSIALLAAGVGIMNIMLVSVTERTREIGIRRAIGAKKRNIMTQFILEAIVLCEVGGVIGVVLGILGGNVLAWYLELSPVIPVDWVIIGLVICSVVGVVFGTYPAYKAANLDPIESLRYE